MPATYEPIATTTLSSAASTITFNSIGSSYTDLRLVLALKAASTQYAQMQFNNDTGSNYSLTWLDGSGSAAASGRVTNSGYIDLSQRTFPSAQISLVTIDIFSYAGSTNKSCLINYNQDNNGSGYVGNQVGLWRSTSAITSIKLISGVSIYDAGTTATLYGIKAA